MNESSLAIPALLFQAMEQEHQAQPKRLQALFAGNLADKKFSAIGHGLEPDFVVISDNTKSALCLIKKYSQSNIDLPLLVSRLGARKIRTSDIDMIDDIGTGTEGWQGSPELLDKFRSQVARDSAEIYPSARNSADLVAQEFIRDDFYLVPRDIKQFKLPTFLATQEAKEKLAAGECALSVAEAVTITFNEPVTSKKWALAVTCWYAYATSLKVQALAGATGAVLGGLAGGLRGAFAGAVGGAVAADVLLRIPVMIWAHKTGKKTILYANAAYCIIVIAFETLAAFKAIKASKEISKLGQAAAAAKTGARAGARSGGGAARGMTDAARANIKIADIKAAESGLAFDQIKVLLARFAAELVTGLVADPNLDTAALAAIFEDPDRLETLVGESQKVVKDYVDGLYPDI